MEEAEKSRGKYMIFFGACFAKVTEKQEKVQDFLQAEKR